MPEPDQTLYGMTPEDRRRQNQLWQEFQRRTDVRSRRNRPPVPTFRKRYYKAPTGGVNPRVGATPGETTCARVKRDRSGNFYVADETESILSAAPEAAAKNGERLLIAEFHTGSDGVDSGAWHIDTDFDCADDATIETILPAGVSNNAGFSTGFSIGFDSSGYYTTGAGGGLNGGVGLE